MNIIIIIFALIIGFSFKSQNMKYFLLISINILLCVTGFAQTIESAQSGDWNETSTWVGGTIPDASNSSSIIIRANHTVEVTGTHNADQLTVEGSGVLNISGNLTILDGTGDDLSIAVAGGFGSRAGKVTVMASGTIINQGNINSTAANFDINGVYEHDLNGGVIATANWIVGSSLDITGVSSVVPTGLGQNFYNLNWNSPLSGFISLANGLTTVLNDFTILDTGGQYLVLSSSNGGINIGGDLAILNNSSLGITESSVYTVDIGGDMILNSTATISFLGTFSGSVDVTVAGDFLKINNSQMDLSAESGSTIFNFNSDVTIDAGTITETGTGSGTFNFTGGALQTFANSGTISQNIDYSISNNSTLSLGTSALTGAGSLTLTSGSAIQVGSTATSGAIQNSGSAGNIRVTGARTYESGSTIIYNGVAQQFIGSGHPSSTGVNLTLDNTSGISLASNLTVGNQLTLNSGVVLSVLSRTLTLDDGITGGGTIAVTSNSNIILNGNNSSDTFPFEGDAPTLNNFTLNRSSGSVIFEDDVTITGLLALNNGDLIFSNQVLMLNGTYTSASGLLYSNSGSVLQVNGSGTFGTIAFNTNGNTLGELDVNRVGGTVGLTGTLNITDSLKLNQGTFNVPTGSTLILADNSTLSKATTAIYTGESPSVASPNTYNLVYTGSSQTTGAELPSAVDTDELGDLTINSSASITLEHDVQVNGTVTLQNGSLGVGSNTLTVTGNWVRNDGSLENYTGLIVFDGASTITSGGVSPTFGNVQVTSTASLSLPASTVAFRGNIQVDAGSTFDADGGTIRLTDSNTQTISFSNSIVNNLTINKTGGVVNMGNAMRIQGTLNIQTATELNTNDNSLVLLSTSDGTTGNATVSSLANGGSVNGDVTVQRYISSHASNIWRYLSSPVADATINDWEQDILVSNGSIYYYDETIQGSSDAGWVIQSSGLLVPGRGYSTYIFNSNQPHTVSVTGALNQGDVDLGVTYTVSAPADTSDGWNLVGNPNAATIDWDNTGGWTKTNINTGIAVTDNESGVFRYWNGTVGGLNDGKIAKGQAFWVKANGASPELIVKEVAKTTTGAFYREAEEAVLNSLMITLNDKNGRSDDTYWGLNEQASNNFDNNFDIKKRDNAIFDLSTVDGSGSDMAISVYQKFTCSDRLYLNIKDVENGGYTLVFNGLTSFVNGEKFVLVDSYLNEEYELVEGYVYNFNTDSELETKGKRFYLKLLNVEPQISLVDGVLTSSYLFGNQWYLNGEIIEGATAQSYIPTESGVYSVKVCEFSADLEYLITGIDTISDAISIYPNPLNSGDVLTINLNENLSLSTENHSLRVLNSNGQAIYSEIFTGNNINLNVKMWPTGVYLLNITDKNSNIYRKIIKH